MTVSELTAQIKETLEAGFDDLRIEGELSNFKRHSSGHCYFTLKDAGASISCVMWRWMAERLFFSPESGMAVQVSGHVSVYEVRGQYQLYVKSMRPAGEGELQAAFERMKRRLQAEGLFDDRHKRPIPGFPETIGVVTSKTGAALQDILSVLARRFPQVLVLVAGVRVQGAGAAEEIAQALESFDALIDTPTAGVPLPDVLIVGRGGGSVEDLWAFNEERVARALFACRIPVISAVGHETDFSIADFVADVRAATPSMGAELAVPDRRDLAQRVLGYEAYLREHVEQQITEGQRRVEALTNSYQFRRPVDRLRQALQRTDDLTSRLTDRVQDHLRTERSRLAQLHAQLEVLDPTAPLRRGYAKTEDPAGTPVTSARDAATVNRLKLRFSDGDLDVEAWRRGS